MNIFVHAPSHLLLTSSLYIVLYRPETSRQGHLMMYVPVCSSQCRRPREQRTATYNIPTTSLDGCFGFIPLRHCAVITAPCY